METGGRRIQKTINCICYELNYLLFMNAIWCREIEKEILLGLQKSIIKA